MRGDLLCSRNARPPKALVGREQSQIIHEAYRQHGYRLAEIATHLGMHYATVSRRLKRVEQVPV
jgi:DNA-binding MarR family transcriptional regulator